MKKIFLVGYDYGAGGVWSGMFANSKSQILERYPELIVAVEKPDWMSQEMYKDFMDKPIDVSDSNSAFLRAVLSQR